MISLLLLLLPTFPGLPAAAIYKRPGAAGRTARTSHRRVIRDGHVANKIVNYYNKV